MELRPARSGCGRGAPDDVDAGLAALLDPDIRLWNGGWVRRGRTPPRCSTGGWTGAATTRPGRSWTPATERRARLGLRALDRPEGERRGDRLLDRAGRAGSRRGRASPSTPACRWAFATLPVDRIELCHAVENTASGRVAEKAGFTYEGHLRRSYRYGDGVKHDELLWARLADDPAPEISSRS